MQLREVVIPLKVVKYLYSLDEETHQRILGKLKYYASLPNPQSYAERLVNFSHGTYRYRVGDYRIIIDFDNNGKLIIVGIIAHRKDVYK